MKIDEVNEYKVKCNELEIETQDLSSKLSEKD